MTVDFFFGFDFRCFLCFFERVFILLIIFILLAPSFEVDETIKYVIFFQLLNFAQSGGVDVFSWLVETTVETRLLGDALK